MTEATVGRWNGAASPAPDERGMAGSVGPWLPGPMLFARFAFPPNRLGLCGPDAGQTLPERVRSGRPDPELSRIAQQFEGAWPYLELIASENGVADPLDARVVEAYWLGNELLGDVGPRARHDDLTDRFRARTRPREWRWLEAKAGGPSLVHHSFHVLEILPRIGMIRGGLPPDLTGALERCLVRPGRVVAVEGGTLDVELPPLEFLDGQLQFGVPRRVHLPPVNGEGFGDILRPGDDVAVHWDRVCGRLDPSQVARLTAVTARNLAVANTTI
jgi:Family of unknown function (DUF6390)